MQSKVFFMVIIVLLFLSIVLPIDNVQAETFIVTHTADTDDGICDSDCSLRDAINTANGTPGQDTVLIPAGNYIRTIPFPLIISDDMDIVGEENNTIIDADRLDRVFDIPVSEITVQISNITIKRGDIAFGGGAGILNRSNLTLLKSSVTGNVAQGAGGISSFGTLNVIDSTVSENISLQESGGGISSAGTLTVTGSTVSGNWSGWFGGGIASRDTATLLNTTVSENFAWAHGGGIYNGPKSTMTIVNSTIKGNSIRGPYLGTAIENYRGLYGMSAATLNIKNSIIEGTCRKPITSNGGNIESPGNTCELRDPTDQVNVSDPMLGSLVDNGGPTLTHALLLGSPAIDTGENTNCPETDQRGAIRDDGLCDIGSFEFGSAFQLVISSSIPVSMKLNEFSSIQLETLYGNAPFIWSISDGMLPSGLNLSGDGVLSGSPTELGEFSFTIEVIDADGDVVEKDFVIIVVFILPPPDIRIFKTGTRAVPGRILDYFIVVQNVGRDPTRNVEVLEILDPEKFSLISVDPPAVADVPTLASASIVSWIIPTMLPGGIEILFYQAKLNPSVPLGDDVVGGPVCSGENLTLKWVQCLNDGLGAFPACAVCVPICQSCPILCAPPEVGECPACLAICSTCLVGVPVPGGSSCMVSVWNFTKNCFDAATTTGSCGSDNQTASAPVDPNEKEVVAKKFIQPDQTLVYPIHFENIGTVEALDVFVTDQLDPNLDTSTLQILTPGASFTPATNTVKWDLLDRNLQPGETGNVLLSIKPLLDLPSGTEIRNDATIQFEIFETIVTNEVVNIIDTTPPECIMDLLASTSAPEFTISWDGMDTIGEIDSYSIFVSVDGGGFTSLLEKSLDTNMVFSGERGKTYEFLCVAVDTAGNVEDQPLVAEAVTAVFENRPPVANAGPDQTLECTSFIGASATLDGSASSDPDDDILSYLWTGSFGATNDPNPTVTLPVDPHIITLTVDDNRGGSDSDAVMITVQDTIPPGLQVPVDIVEECAGSNGQSVDIGIALAEDVCSENVIISNDVAALFPLGQTNVTWSAEDEFGNTSQAAQSINIADTTPPEISILCSPDMLWPPNHKIVEIIPDIFASDICDTSLTVELDQIIMNEGEEINAYDPDYDEGLGNGNTINDIQVSDDDRIYLRAERSGNNPDGRIYTIIYKATDASGNISTASCKVSVPHDMK